eukprot:13525834-Heterocapsa_arctica.AAC.1
MIHPWSISRPTASPPVSTVLTSKYTKPSQPPPKPLWRALITTAIVSPPASALVGFGGFASLSITSWVSKRSQVGGLSAFSVTTLGVRSSDVKPFLSAARVTSSCVSTMRSTLAFGLTCAGNSVG